MSDSELETGEKTHEVTLSETEVDHVERYASENECSENDMIEAMVSDFIMLREEGWLALRESSKVEDLTGFGVLYEGRKVRNLMILLSAVYLLFTVGILSLLLIADPGDPVTFLEFVAAVGFLIVSVLVTLIFVVLLQTPFPEYLEHRYL
jgi:hypothetical protein